jgi:hypothetical protein
MRRWNRHPNRIGARWVPIWLRIIEWHGDWLDNWMMSRIRHTVRISIRWMIIWRCDGIRARYTNGRLYILGRKGSSRLVLMAMLLFICR